MVGKSINRTLVTNENMRAFFPNVPYASIYTSIAYILIVKRAYFIDYCDNDINGH